MAEASDTHRLVESRLRRRIGKLVVELLPNMILWQLHDDDAHQERTATVDPQVILALTTSQAAATSSDSLNK